MRKTIRIMALLVLAAVIVLPGCTPNTTSTAATTTSTTAGTTAGTTTTAYEWEYMEDTSAFEFDLWWAADWGFNKPAIEAGWDDTNPIYQAITAATGGKINFIKPAGTEDELLGPMIAAGDLPDAMVLGSYNSPYFYQMKDADQLYAFGDLIDEYCPKMWDIIPESMKTLHKEDDGKIWKYVSMIADAVSGAGMEALGMPATSYSNIAFARKDILAAFGATDITDINDLTDYLKYVKANYSDVDPIRLFIGDPRSSASVFFRHMGYGTFGCHLSGAYPKNDGTLTVYMYDPNYVEYLKWLNGLYKEGIISTNMLAEDLQAQEAKQYNAQYGFVLDSMWGVGGTVNDTIKKNIGEDKIYVPIGPIKKDGKWVCDGYRNMGAFATVITKNAEIPDRIIKMFEYMNTEEGQLMMSAGPDGWVFDIVDGDYVPTAEAKELRAADLQGFTTKYKVCGPWAFIMQDYYWEHYLGRILNHPSNESFVRDTYQLRLKPYIRPIWDEGFINIKGNSIKTGSDLDVLYTQIDSICKEAGMQMIIAETEEQFNQLYSDCLAEIESLGVDQVADAFTATYEEKLEMLGLK